MAACTAQPATFHSRASASAFRCLSVFSKSCLWNEQLHGAACNLSQPGAHSQLQRDLTVLALALELCKLDGRAPLVSEANTR